MDLKEQKLRWSGKMTRGKWILLLLVGAALMLLSFPVDSRSRDRSPAVSGESPESQDKGEENGGPGTAGDAEIEHTSSSQEYEAVLEERIRNLLRNVEGVGEVDVMVVLKSSEEKVFRVDTSTSSSQTQEADSQGGTRTAQNSQVEESTALLGGASGQGSTPLLEKELKPEISGIVISAQGGGSSQVQSEISAAMEALFGLPAHKIKVLKRVD